MKKLTLLMAGTAFIALAGAAHAAPVIYDFTGSVVGANVDLGGSHAYTATGGPSLTATAGYASGSPPPSAGDSFSTFSGLNTGHLVGNNRGSDEQGLGVCEAFIGITCSGSSLDGEIGEIDRGTNEVVQINVSGLYAAFTNFTINADSATDGELLGVFQSNSATNLGTFVANITSGSGAFSITPTENYLYFVSDGPAAGGADGGNVLLHTLTVTPDVDINPLQSVPEPGSLAIFGSALLGLGVVGWYRRRKDNGIDGAAA